MSCEWDVLVAVASLYFASAKRGFFLDLQVLLIIGLTDLHNKSCYTLECSLYLTWGLKIQFLLM